MGVGSVMCYPISMQTSSRTVISVSTGTILRTIAMWGTSRREYEILPPNAKPRTSPPGVSLDRRWCVDALRHFDSMRIP